MSALSDNDFQKSILLYPPWGPVCLQWINCSFGGCLKSSSCKQEKPSHFNWLQLSPEKLCYALNSPGFSISHPVSVLSTLKSVGFKINYMVTELGMMRKTCLPGPCALWSPALSSRKLGLAACPLRWLQQLSWTRSWRPGPRGAPAHLEPFGTTASEEQH